MIIYPAIDIINGCCVRLKQGDFQQQTTYDVDPAELADSYANAGATWLHMVDLDAARGTADNVSLIGRIARDLSIPIQSGGGVRSLEDIKKRLDAGVNRVVVGSLAVTQADEFCRWLQELGNDNLTAALDVRLIDGHWVPAIAGWQENSDTDLLNLLDLMTAAGLKHLLCTDIDRDGMLDGPNLDLYAELNNRYPQLIIQASGGVHALSDLDALQRIQTDGVVIGKALLDGRFTLKEALQRAGRPL